MSKLIDDIEHIMVSTSCESIHPSRQDQVNIWRLKKIVVRLAEEIEENRRMIKELQPKKDKSIDMSKIAKQA